MFFLRTIQLVYFAIFGFSLPKRGCPEATVNLACGRPIRLGARSTHKPRNAEARLNGGLRNMQPELGDLADVAVASFPELHTIWQPLKWGPL
jgi:hypothetical protein